MEPKITNLSIVNFRAFHDLKIESLGRVNLITGRNNTGKSSVLEALRILASVASPSVLFDILRFREEDAGEMEEATPVFDARGPFASSSLFHGFPNFFEAATRYIDIASEGGQPMQVMLEAGWLHEERGSDGSSIWMTLRVPGEGVPGLAIVAGGKTRPVPLDLLRRYAYGDRSLRPESLDEQSIPCEFVTPNVGERTATLSPLWDKIALSDLEKDVVAALQVIDPGIIGVSMVGGEGPRSGRTAIVRSVDLPWPVPLRSFGDGMNRLFGIILSLVNAKDGLLLIDEFENGMHHTVQTDAWRAIFKLASRLDVQVVATSHSWDAIQAFQKAASESNEEGVLIRLTRKGDDVIPTLFRKDELAIVTRERIEVR